MIRERACYGPPMALLPADPLTRVRMIGAIEALSFLLLLGVGMPMKYLAQEPIFVRVLGPVHGALFIWLMVEVIQLVLFGGWPKKRGVVVFLASLFPAGPLLIDGWLKKQAS